MLKKKIVIIGGGVVGCAVARSLSKYDASVTLLEKAADVAEGASKANSGLVHAGFDAEPGTQKAKFNIAGSRMFRSLCEDIGAPYVNNGAMVLAFSDEQHDVLVHLLKQGLENGVEGLSLITNKDILALEPHTNPAVLSALLVKTSALTVPYELTFALADHAKINGVSFHLNTEVQTIKLLDGHFIIETENSTIKADIVVNCAGISAAKLHNQISDHKLHITPRRGEYYLLDHETKPVFSHTMFQTPTSMGKGVLITPTAHNTLILGPTADDIEDGSDVSTTAQALKTIRDKSTLTWPEMDLRTVITTFSGIRAHEQGGDFVIGAVDNAKGAYEAVGIESPGLTSAPAIGEYLADLIALEESLIKKSQWLPAHIRPKSFCDMSSSEKQEAYATNHEYGEIVCRCEQVTAAEIRAAIRRPVGAVTIDGIKRRTRAGMGRCQGGFCSPRVMEILSEELCIDMMNVTKSGGDSFVLAGRIDDTDQNRSDSHA